MNYVFENGNVYNAGTFVREGLGVCNGEIVSLTPSVSSDSHTVCVDCDSYFLLPGFTDVHVHLREPGFSYKETIRTGSVAAASGGYSTVCSMPNLNPTPDCMEHLNQQLDLIRKDAVIRVLPYGTITVGQQGQVLSDMQAMAPYVVGFSDDGRGVQDDEMMKQAMLQAKGLGKLIVAHCEDNSLLRGGYIHDGVYAKAHGHKGICSESEWRQIARDLELVAKTGCGYHVCHISTRQSVELIRQAKKDGLDVTCETGPHYLLLNDEMLQEDGRFKMNPPLRGEDDRQALLQGILDGTVDMIATDHAPHSAEEKGRGLKDSAMGIVGIETAFALLYTNLVKPGTLSMKRLMELLHEAPNRRFKIEGGIRPGQKACFGVFDLDTPYCIDPNKFLSKGKSTPFAGWEVFGKCRMLVCDGTVVWSDGTILDSNSECL